MRKDNCTLGVERWRDLIAISQKFCCREEACGYTKVIHENKEKVLKKWTSV
jgi:hypothetical protein